MQPFIPFRHSITATLFKKSRPLMLLYEGPAFAFIWHSFLPDPDIPHPESGG